MKVKLIAKTPNMLDVVYTGARTCYNAGSPIDMWDNVDSIADGKKENLIKKVFESGHLSTSEHAYFTFAIEGISRACSHQLVRHRHCSFSQQSQRYVEIKEDLESLLNLRDEAINNGCITSKSLINLLDKYFVDITEENAGAYLDCLIHYVAQTTQGKKPEDARNILPNATKTNIVVSMNLRELIHLCNERLCTRAQLEIRQLVKEMVKEVIKNEEWLKSYLQPKCESLGFCTEAHGSCGRKPHINDIKRP
jgi:thymidylate synthase (FAD)